MSNKGRLSKYVAELAKPAADKKEAAKDVKAEPAKTPEAGQETGK